MKPAGGGMAHDNDDCVKLAELRVVRLAGEAKAKREASRAPIASEKREAQILHRFSAARCDNVLKCIDGKCGVNAPRIFCQGPILPDGTRPGCGKGVHLECSMLSKARGAVGLMLCPDCRAAEMAPHCLSPPESLRRDGARSMLLELTSGAETTARNVADFERLEREWLDHVESDADAGAIGIVAPRHSAESFISFCHWLVMDGNRARSFGTVMRCAKHAMSRLSLPDLTSDKRVKHVINEIAGKVGTDVNPCTIPTTRMIQEMYDNVIPEVCSSSKLIESRTTFLADCEIVGGTRVGEAVAGGDAHGGVLANHCDIATPMNGEDPVTVNLYIEDSKTGFARDVTMINTTQGPLGVEVEKHLRNFWAASGFEIVKEEKDGLIIERPDYWVVRVSLLDMSPAQYERLRVFTRRAQHKDLLGHHKSISGYLKERRSGETLSEEMRYVNFGGGPKHGAEIEHVVNWLRKLGFGKFVNVVPGPLIRATRKGEPSKLSHMPLATASTYTHISGSLNKAYQAVQDSGVPDTELDLEGLSVPKWGNHANRRYADKKALATQSKTGVSEVVHNDHFGWAQKEQRKKSALHYRGRVERLERAKVTSLL